MRTVKDRVYVWISVRIDIYVTSFILCKWKHNFGGREVYIPFRGCVGLFKCQTFSWGKIEKNFFNKMSIKIKYCKNMYFWDASEFTWIVKFTIQIFHAHKFLFVLQLLIIPKMHKLTDYIPRHALQLKTRWASFPSLAPPAHEYGSASPAPLQWTRCIDWALARSHSQLFSPARGHCCKTEGQNKNRDEDNRASKGASRNLSSIGSERLCPRACAAIWEPCVGWTSSFAADGPDRKRRHDSQTESKFCAAVRSCDFEVPVDEGTWLFIRHFRI